MKTFNFLIICIFSCCLFTKAIHASTSETADFQKYFGSYAAATFVMYDESNDKYIVFNEIQSNKRLSPCSTFKIYNSLAGLESGVLDYDDMNTLLKWDGKRYDFPGWNQDQTLSSAIRNSVVWYFQDLASSVGSEYMQDFLNRIGYGNHDISGGLTTFWLSSSLQISAREQVDLLYKLYSGQLPVADESVKIVQKNITLSDEQGVRLMGKTGTAFQDSKSILGWFVGCVQKDAKRYFFATNIEAPEGASGLKAKEITKSILESLNLIGKSDGDKA